MTAVFDDARASSQDKQFSRLAPIREALHLLIRMTFSGLPQDARVLCVGAGTGPELIDLAIHNPDWTFTVVEPAAPMLKVCRQQAQEKGISSRCFFHQGYLETLSNPDKFHAATSILVSQFISESEARCDFFKGIRACLGPEGVFINADLASDTSSAMYQVLKDTWAQTMAYAGVPQGDIEKLGKDVTVLAAEEIESMIHASGFEPPVCIYQSLLIHAWVTHAR